MIRAWERERERPGGKRELTGRKIWQTNLQII